MMRQPVLPEPHPFRSRGGPGGGWGACADCSFPGGSPVHSVSAGGGAGAALETHPYVGPTYDGNGWIDSCGAKVDGRYCFKLPEHPIHQTTTLAP